MVLWLIFRIPSAIPSVTFIRQLTLQMSKIVSDKAIWLLVQIKYQYNYETEFAIHRQRPLYKIHIEFDLTLWGHSYKILHVRVLQGLIFIPQRMGIDRQVCLLLTVVLREDQINVKAHYMSNF